MGYRTILADGGVGALGFVSQRKDIALLLLDLAMPDMDGCAVLTKMREAGHAVPVIALAHNDDMQKVTQAIRLGASDFMTKPVIFERMQVSVANVLKLDALMREVRRIRSSLKAHLSLAEMVTKSPEMQKVETLARRAITLDAPLLIEGEPGAGKETLARAICGGGARWQGAFVVTDCRSLTPDIADEILFGTAEPHDGDPLKAIGKLAEAQDGTLFLDEVGELPPRTQARLLAAMQTGQYEDGSGATVSTNARIMASNSVPLAHLVHTGRFHAGLYHLLTSFSIAMPPLRDRIEDIPLLAHEFVIHFAGEERLGHVTGIAAHTLERLKRHDWPGNVRELKNATYRAVMLCDGSELTVGDFPQLSAAPATVHHARRDSAIEIDARTNLAASTPFGQDAVAFTGINADGQVQTLAATEAEMIRFAIAHYDGQLSEVARRLGIGRTTLYRKLKEYGIDVATLASKGSDGQESASTAFGGRMGN